MISYQGLAELVDGKREGAKKAVHVLRGLGGITEVEVIRRRDQQGIKISIDRSRQFHAVTLETSRGFNHRGRALGTTVEGQTQGPGTSMYVSSNTDIRELLDIFPVEWKVREQTLREIAALFPSMSQIEFRRSLRYLVDQAVKGKGPEKNPNGWLKAAFGRTGGPLVTEAMIESELDRPPARPSALRRAAEPDETAGELASLRRYVAANPEERAIIEARAEERVAPLLATVAEDKHAGIREQARIECAREFFTAREKSGEGEES